MAGSNEIVLNAIAADVSDSNGDHTGLWNTTDANWNTTSGKYANGDVAGFTAGTGNGNVAIATTLTPLGVVVRNNSLYYTFSGAGNIGGTASLVEGAPAPWRSTWPTTPIAAAPRWTTASCRSTPAPPSPAALAKGPLGVGTITLGGGTFQGSVTLANAVSVIGNTTLSGLTFGPQSLATPNTFTVTGAPAISVTTPVTIADPIAGDTLNMAGPSTMTITSAANTVSTYEVSGGALAATAAIVNTTPVTLAGGNLQLTQPGDRHLAGADQRHRLGDQAGRRRALDRHAADLQRTDEHHGGHRQAGGPVDRLAEFARLPAAHERDARRRDFQRRYDHGREHLRQQRDDERRPARPMSPASSARGSSSPAASTSRSRIRRR